jgi:hypothetical protein
MHQKAIKKGQLIKSWPCAQDGNRTRTSNRNRILSPARLPIPPPGQQAAKVCLLYHYTKTIL